jgi:hypothetical protein
MNPFNVHTPGNAIPNVDGTTLGDLLADLAGIHPGIDLIRDGIRLLAHDRHNTNTTQVLLARLAGDPDGSDILNAIGHLVARLADSDHNPCLRTLPFGQQCQAFKHGNRTAIELSAPELRTPASNANAALDTPGGRCQAVTDDERKELSQKNSAKNARSEKPYPK